MTQEAGVLRQTKALVVRNLRTAKRLWPEISKPTLQNLREITVQFALSVGSGDAQVLDGRLYVTHTGLLRIAQRNRCSGIRTIIQKDLSDAPSGRWVVKAIVYRTPRSRGFVGYGDADPSNVAAHLRGCELRIAETRAVNRALRKAYGIGLCSVEELGSFSAVRAATDPFRFPVRANGNGSGNGQPRLRDQLCQLIRRYRLDAAQVKSYAAEFCGTEQLRDASREMVQNFLRHLSEWAAQDVNGLICHLNRYASDPPPAQEVHSS